MLMHASVNNFTGIVPAAVAGATTPFALRAPLVAGASVGLSWAVAAPLLAEMRGADITASPTSRGVYGQAVQQLRFRA